MEKSSVGTWVKVPITMNVPVSRSSPAAPKASVKPSSVSEEASVKVISMVVNKKKSYNDHHHPDFSYPVLTNMLIKLRNVTIQWLTNGRICMEIQITNILPDLPQINMTRAKTPISSLCTP